MSLLRYPASLGITWLGGKPAPSPSRGYRGALICDEGFTFPILLLLTPRSGGGLSETCSVEV